MHFARSLKRTIYAPWKDKYIDYAKLKILLKEDGSDDGSNADLDSEGQWTDEDESAFVEELVNVQLEKVHAFQSETVQSLRDRTAACEAKLDDLLIKPNQEDEQAAKFKEEVSGAKKQETLKDVSRELDNITEQMNELEKYSRINYTGFLKATKKHDRRRGHAYRVRPLMQVRLSALPFNKEDYSPLLFRISAMYAFVRQHLDGGEKSNKGISFSESQVGTEEFVSQKFWVHPENLLELRTVILRRLPVLIYNPQSLKVADGGRRDPSITSIYFDNPKFSLYNDKIGHAAEASSLRLRWFGQLSQEPEIFCEKKTVREDEVSKEDRFTIKEKYVKAFLRGDYKLDKDVKRMRERYGEDSEQAKVLLQNVESIQQFVKEQELQPVVRANYTRQAFQIPGDDHVRITLDTDLALIREDALDTERPCRDPEDWHRRDIDDAEMEYPFTKIRKGEINRFPFALLEIKTKGVKQYEWISDLMDSHLVKPAPRFSKFVHGVAQLFDDYINSFPFWLSDVETDIRKDPQQAFEEEQERKAKVAEDQFAVGSLLGKGSHYAFRASLTSPVGSPTASALNRASGRATSEMTRRSALEQESKSAMEQGVDEDDSDDEIPQAETTTGRLGGLRSLLPGFSTSKYGQRHRQGRSPLPPGVSEPTFWIKDEGPVRVEAKVWLANQRTFVKWQHVAVLLASLSLGLYNAAGANNTVARTLAVVYTLIALFTGTWGWGVYMYRSRLIQQRSGKDLDSVVGPMVVCISLAAALCLNFAFKYNAAIQDRKDSPPAESLNASIIELSEL